MTFKQYLYHCDNSAKYYQNVDLSYINLTDLYGIEECIHILDLNISNNLIEDLEPLKHLPYLKILNIAFNKLDNLDLILQLEYLDCIFIHNNPITLNNPLYKDLSWFSRNTIFGIRDYKLTELKNIIKFERRKRLINLL